MDSLVPNQRKKQLMPDRTMEPPAGRQHHTFLTSHAQNSLVSLAEGVHIRRHRGILQEIRSPNKKSEQDLSNRNATSYLTCWDVLFCPWGGQRRCFRAARPASPGSWRSRPSRRCNRRRTSSDSRSCCGGRSCWSPLNLSVWRRRCLEMCGTRGQCLTHTHETCSLELLFYLRLFQPGPWTFKDGVIIYVI